MRKRDAARIAAASEYLANPVRYHRVYDDELLEGDEED